jgi:hypothetical protein
MIGMSLTLEMLFLLELLLVALMIVVVVAGVIYIAIHDRRIRRETGRQVGTADVAVGTTSQERANVMTQGPASHQPPRRDFYERLELDKSAQIRFHLYSRDQYQSELGGSADSLEREGFVGALKAYRSVDGEWYDYPPQKAEDLLKLESGDYEIDEENSALLFRRLPHGFPISARDAIRT